MLLEDIFQERRAIPILKHIYLAKEGCGISEISKNTGIPKSAVFTALSRLEKKSILISRQKGGRKIFKINCGNFFVKNAIEGIFELENNIIDGVKKDLAESFKARDFRSVILYGSFGTPKFDFSSDIDIMVIADKKQAAKKVEKITKSFFEKGIILFADVLSLKEFENLRRMNEPLIKKVVETGIIISGKHPLELIR